MARFFRRGAGKGSSLQAELKRATNSGVIDIPKELMDPVIDALDSVENRKEVMKHLREGLAEPSAKHWKRLHASLLLTEALVQRGSSRLWVETAEGHHFDIVQRIAFLEHFQLTTDKRVENMIRTKATALRPEVIAKLENASVDDEEELTKCGGDVIKDTASTCSPGNNSVGASISTFSLSVDGDTPTGIEDHGVDLSQIIDRKTPKGPIVLDNIVRVGHNDDTTSESEGEESRTRVREKRRSKRRSAKECDSDGPSGVSRSVAKQETKIGIQAAPMDLLDLADTAVSQGSPPTETIDLLNL